MPVKRSQFVVFLVLFGFVVNAFADGTVRATIYYFDWDVYVRSAMTPEKVRQNFYTRIEISDPDEAKKLSKVITGQKFEPIPRPNVMDVRLVVDLTMEDGSVHSYVADKFRIYAPDNVSSARINDEFKDRFRIGRQRVK